MSKAVESINKYRESKDEDEQSLYAGVIDNVLQRIEMNLSLFRRTIDDKREIQLHNRMMINAKKAVLLDELAKKRFSDIKMDLTDR